MSPYRYYMLPLGLWQWWAIFAPDPLRENRVLEAEVIDAKRLIHIYEFTKIGDLSLWRKIRPVSPSQVHRQHGGWR